MIAALVHSALPNGRAPCFTECSHLTITANNDYCRHRFRVGGFFTCPFCKPVEASEAPAELVAPAVVAPAAPRRNAGLSNNVHRASRSLDLAGKTIAGCLVVRIAAAATRHSRWHAVMSCGHPKIVDGSELTAADRAKKTLKCSACNRADSIASQKATKLAAKGGGDG